MPVKRAIVALAIALAASVSCAAATDDSLGWDDFFQSISTGWFPRPYAAIGYFAGSTLNFYQHSSATNITTSGTRPIVGRWSAHNPFRSHEDDIKKPWSADDADDDFPSLGYSAPINLRVEWMLPLLHCMARFDVAYELSRERLYSLDTSRKYLALSGQPTPFREVSVLFNNEHFLGARLGVAVPIYGAFVTSQPLRLDTMRRIDVIDRISSFYYVAASLHAAALVLSEATQYVQIADAKDAIRYRNGQDTVTLMNKARLSTATPLRWHAEIAAGWQASFGSFAFTVEAYAELPLTSVLRDARWMLYRYGIRTMIGRQQ
uniref:Uncharacterized protein n=1 Tax=uncultured Bacteroidota bacterium TaxID=152509 RepID=H5SG23_9BACT|nr:hypothetical protein HGMM_F23B02C48 [uncultured Bacteroidetes bacterium]